MIFKQETVKSWFTSVNDSINNDVIQPFQNAEQVIYKYNQAIQHNSLTQQGWTRLLAQSDDGLKAYLTNIKGTTASMAGYNVSLQGSITGFTKISSAIKQYNALATAGIKEQNTFATAVSITNGKLGTYLTGLNGAKASLSGYGISLIASTAKTIGLTVATSALNAALTMGISLILSGLISSFVAWINKSEKITKKAQEAADKIISIRDSLKSNIETVEKTKKRYAELAQEVENLGKISQSKGTLSNEEYEEFLDLSNQLSNVFPSLSKNYDENGNSILTLSGSVDTIVNSLDDLIKKEKELTNQKIMEKFPNVFAGYAQDFSKAEQNVKNSKTKFDKINNAYQQLLKGSATQAFNLYGNGEFENENGEKIKITLAEYEQVLKELEIAYKKTDITVKNQFGGDTLSGYLIEVTGDIDTAFTSKLETAREDLQYAQQQLEGQKSSINSYLNTWLQTEFLYNQIEDNGLQAAIQDMLFNLDWSSLFESVDKNDWDAVSEYLRKNILFSINNINVADVSKAFSDIYNGNLNSGELLDSIAKVQEYFGTEHLISVFLQTKVDDIQPLINNVKDKLQDEFDDKVGELTLEELQIAAEKIEVPNGTLLSWDKLILKIKEVQSLNSLSSTPSLFDDLTSIKEKMDTLTSSASSLSSALTTLYSGDYNSSDLLSSITTINSAIADFGTGLSIDWEHITSVDQLEEELQKLSETYAESMLSNAGITLKNNPFAKMIQNSIVESIKLKAQLDGVNTALDTLQSNYKTLMDTIETYNEYGYITIDQLQSLLEMDDKYIACLIDENGQLNLNKTAYANLTKMQLENARATALTEYESEVARIKQEALTRANQNLGASIGAENAGLIGKLDSLSGRFTVLSGVMSVAKNIFGKFKNAIDEFKSQAQVDIDNIVLDKQAEKELEEAERAYNARLKLIGSVSDNLNDSMDRIMGNSDSSSKSSSSDTVFDWIETRISRIQRLFQNMVDSVTKYVSSNFKLTTIDKEISSLNEQIHTYQIAAQRYLQEANSVSISGDIRHKVINGEIDIQQLTDEDTIKAVNSFKEWYEKYLDAIDQAVKLENDKRDKIREKVDARLSAIQSDRERLSVKAERKKDTVDYKEAIGANAYSSEYQWLINNSRQQYSSYQSENTVLKEYLSTLTKSSEEWEDIQKQIESNEASMRDLISSQTEWNNKIAQMPMEKAERTIEKLSAKNEFINAKYENSNYALHKHQMNRQLATNAKLELKANQTAYTESKNNFNTASYNINHISSDSLVAKVQKYTKAGKEIPSDVLAIVYNSGNALLIHRCSQYNAAYLAMETAKDTYNLSKEQTKTELSNLGQKNVEAVSASFTNKYTRIDNKKSYLDALKENTEANGRYVDSSYYNQMIAQVSKELSLKTNEQKKLQAIIDKNLQDGLWTIETQAYKDAVFQIEQLKTEIVELTTEQKNYNNALNQMPIDQIQTTLDILDALANRDASKNSLKKAQGKDLSVTDYQKELDNTQNQIDKTLELRNKYYNKYMNAKLKGNQADADKYLQLYYEEDTAVNNLKETYEELMDTMRDDVYWRSLERAHKAAQNLESTLSAISDLFSEDMFFDDNGSFTDMAVAKIGTLVKQYETAKEEVNNYTNDIENLNKLYKNGYYTQEEYKEKLAELQDGLLGAANDVKTYTDSIIELYISQKDAELEALKELIDKRKEALNAKKAYYDYDKTINDKTKDIKSLQAQVAALEGIETAEAKAQLARYKSQLQEAQEDLEDTKFEHKIELIVDGFDSLQTELQENHDEYVKNLKSSFDAQIDIIESANSVYAESYKQIIQSMTKMLEYYGMDTSTIQIKSLAGFAEGGIVHQVYQNGDKVLASGNPSVTSTKQSINMLSPSVDIMSQFLNLPKTRWNNIVPNINLSPAINIHYDNLLTVNGDVIDMEKTTMDIVNHNMKMIADEVSKDFSQQIRKMGFK